MVKKIRRRFYKGKNKNYGIDKRLKDQRLDAV